MKNESHDARRPWNGSGANGRTIMSYIFYDTETTGKVTAFDQILQFATGRRPQRCATETTSI
jgi:hypothetical protein